MGPRWVPGAPGPFPGDPGVNRGPKYFDEIRADPMSAPTKEAGGSRSSAKSVVKILGL